jgi:hypothetical protein
MPRFLCSHPTTALIKHITPSGKVLAFDYRGVLDTDEEGAAVIRAHPLHGRLILEGDESAPAHAEVPAPETPPTVVVAQERQPRTDLRALAAVPVPCLFCGKLFVPRSLIGLQLYCKPKCRRKAYWARHYAPESAP